LSSKSRNTIRRNSAILPAYSFVLGLLALLGWVAIAAGTKPIGLDGKPNAQLVVPQLFEDMFPSWFAGVAFAAIAIGALVPAAIMAIAAANLFTRNIYREWFKPNATPSEEAKVGKVVSLVVKFVALVFVLTMDKQNAINFQLLGGIWILQTFPAIVFGLYTRWFHRWALLGGWAVGMVYGTIAAYNVVKPTPDGGMQHFAGSVALIPGLAQLGYIALTSFAINVIVAVVLTFVLGVLKTPTGADATIKGDYFADEGDPRVVKIVAGPHEYSPSP
jgi:solute:Na+ symporter, SSS family